MVNVVCSNGMQQNLQSIAHDNIVEFRKILIKPPISAKISARTDEIVRYVVFKSIFIVGAILFPKMHDQVVKILNYATSKH